MSALFVCLLCGSLLLFGQAGTGTITGIVTDSQGAVVAGAAVEVKNTATGQVYPGATSGTGNFSITQLPPGPYELTVKEMGFKTYNHKNIQVQAAQVLRQDAALEVGVQGDVITVTGEATLLQTESGDLAVNISVDSLDNLPILGIGTTNSGSSGVRNPYNMLQLLPGVGNYIANNTMIINGLGGAGTPTEAMRVEGQDMTNHLVSFAVQENQPSADAVQEVAIQTSNYAPEFGTAGAAVLNITMKSGTNQFHGSVYDYLVNEDLNAGYPFSVSTTSGQKFRPRNRRNDYGGTIGGPVWIPKVYDGRNKTFFFFNLERYIESNFYTFTDTVPQPYMNQGDFSALSPNGTCSLCSTYNIQQTALGTPTTAVDPLGRNLFANTIYDPLSRKTVASSGLGYADPFTNNMIPASRLDPVALSLSKLFPKPDNSNLTGDYAGNILGHRTTAIPSIKLDESVTQKNKLSFYFSKTGTDSAVAFPNGNADGLPLEIGAYRGTHIYNWTYRLNYDRTISPTFLLHLGAGWWRLNFGDAAPFTNFDPSQFGLSGFLIHRQFPLFTGMSGAYGGMQNIGTAGQIQTNNRQLKPSYNANVTKVSGSHTIKAGGEVYFQGTLLGTFAGVTYTTGVGPTAQPYANTTNLNGFSIGLPYASFMLGDYNSTNQSPELDYRNGKQQWAFFVQDSWKVTRKLTVDYGIRYDVGTAVKETYGRLGQFDATEVNTSAGNHLGGLRYASTCKCNFYPGTYPYALGPRLGAAYQIDANTVLRAGWGVVYQYTTDTAAGSTVSSAGLNQPAGVNFGTGVSTAFVNTQSPGFLLQPTWPITNPNQYPSTIGTTNGTPTMADANLNRPPRQNQWSIGIQRQITRNLVAEASWVANRDVWLGGPLGFLNQISPETYAKFGLYPYPGTGPAGYNNYADSQLLNQPISATAVKQKMQAAGIGNGGLLLPYATASTTTTLNNALRSFPQFPTLAPTGSATGNERYDSLQAKVTKRFSHGLQASGAFTWEKSFTRAGRQDFFNPQSSVWGLQNLPLRILTFNFTYTTPSVAYLSEHGKWLNQIVKDWQLGGFANYQSGSFIPVPASNTSNFLTSEEVRVPGKSLYLKDPNGNLNPYYDQVLNPAAWNNLGQNQVGGSSAIYYTDFRNPRHPSESGNIARNFRLTERFTLQFRGEFVNLFNRTELPNFYTAPGAVPTTPNTTAALGKNSQGIYTSGFGVMNVYTAANTATTGSGGGNVLSPRSGTLVLRLTF